MVPIRLTHPSPQWGEGAVCRSLIAKQIAREEWE